MKVIAAPDELVVDEDLGNRPFSAGSFGHLGARVFISVDGMLLIRDSLGVEQ